MNNQRLIINNYDRCVQSIGASASACLGAGTIADLYPVEKRGYILLLYSITLFYYHFLRFLSSFHFCYIFIIILFNEITYCHVVIIDFIIK